MDFIDLLVERLDAMAAVIALVAATFSAIAATVSAQQAKKANENAQRAEKQSVWREVNRLWHAVRIGIPAVASLLDEAKTQWDSTYVGAGFGGTRHQRVRNRVEKWRGELMALEQEHLGLNATLSAFSRLGPDDVTRLMGNLDTMHQKVEALRQDALRDLMKARSLSPTSEKN